jgi:hypothetical protein
MNTPDSGPAALRGCATQDPSERGGLGAAPKELVDRRHRRRQGVFQDERQAVFVEVPALNRVARESIEERRQAVCVYVYVVCVCVCVYVCVCVCVYR